MEAGKTGARGVRRDVLLQTAGLRRFPGTILNGTDRQTHPYKTSSTTIWLRGDVLAVSLTKKKSKKKNTPLPSLSLCLYSPPPRLPPPPLVSLISPPF